MQRVPTGKSRVHSNTKRRVSTQRPVGDSALPCGQLSVTGTAASLSPSFTMSALKRTATCCMRRVSPCGVKETTSAGWAFAAFASSSADASKVLFKMFNKNI